MVSSSNRSISRTIKGGKLMEKITAELSLTKAEWSILSLAIHNVAPLLPTEVWDVTDRIEEAINNSLKQKDKEVK